jgi:hypothetical protein
MGNLTQANIVVNTNRSLFPRDQLSVKNGKYAWGSLLSGRPERTLILIAHSIFKELPGEELLISQ